MVHVLVVGVFVISKLGRSIEFKRDRTLSELFRSVILLCPLTETDIYNFKFKVSKFKSFNF